MHLRRLKRNGEFYHINWFCYISEMNMIMLIITAKRGGGTGSKRGKRKEIAKERSPKEDGDSFLIGMEECM